MISHLTPDRDFFAAAFFFSFFSAEVDDDDDSLVDSDIGAILSIANPCIGSGAEDADPVRSCRCAAAATTSHGRWSLSLSEDLVVSSSELTVRPRAHRDMATSSTPGSVMVAAFGVGVGMVFG
jgi:hypothetical protein